MLIECSGNAQATVAGLRALDLAGRAVLVGMGGDELALPLSVVQERELEVTGTFRYANTWPTAIELVASGRVDLDRLVTGTYRLDQAEEALTAARQDPASVKAVVRPQTWPRSALPGTTRSGLGRQALQRGSVASGEDRAGPDRPSGPAARMYQAAGRLTARTVNQTAPSGARSTTNASSPRSG